MELIFLSTYNSCIEAVNGHSEDFHKTYWMRKKLLYNWSQVKILSIFALKENILVEKHSFLQRKLKLKVFGDIWIWSLKSNYNKPIKKPNVGAKYVSFQEKEKNKHHIAASRKIIRYFFQRKVF